MDLSKKIAGYLLEKEAVKVSMNPPFTWTSGIKSPVYCDNRKMLGFVGAREEIVAGFRQVIQEKGLEFDVIGGTATAAIPWAAFLAQELHKPMIYIRPQKKEHGTGKQIEGFLPGGQRVLIVEDLVSTGGSSVAAAQVVREEGGCEVVDILAIVTYEMAKSVVVLKEAGIELHTLTNFSEIMALASEQGTISAEQLEVVMKFREDPQGWGGKNGF